MFRSRPFGRLLPLGLHSPLLGSHAPRPLSCIIPACTRYRLLPVVVSRCIATSSTTNVRPFKSAPRPKIPPPLHYSYSDESLLMDQLKDSKLDKWGYVIYRCTYKDDGAWERFKTIVHEQAQEDLDATPELANRLEWTFVEDREILDGASIPQLRERFNRWAAKAVVAENPRAQVQTQGRPTAVSGRYCCFIHVDEEALQSVMAAPEQYVNLVDSLWQPMGDDRYHGHGYGPDDPLNEVLDPIDGCAEENVGWMRVELGLAFSAYLYVGAGDTANWYLSYRRPPEVVWQ